MSSDDKPGRVPGRPFPKGVSGNPGGQSTTARVATRRLKIMCQKHADEAIATILEVMRNKEEAGRTRVYAAEVLLERGFGKPDVDTGADAGDAAGALAKDQADRVLGLLTSGALAKRAH